MPEKLEIVVGARDQASGVIRQVAGTFKGEVQGMQAASQKLAGATGTLATTTTGAFGKMKAASGAYRAELAATGLAVAGLATGAFLLAKSFVSAAIESEKASTRLRVAIQAAGKGVRQPELEELAKQLQKITPYSDEAITGMMAFLASAKLNEQQIKRLTPALLDLGTFMGRDIESAAKMLAYALETGTTKGFARLKIVVDEAKFALDPIGALLDAIASKCGGMAKAAGKDAAGQLAIFYNQADELKESLGRGLLPALQAIVDISTPVASSLAAIADSDIGRWALKVAIPILGLGFAIRGIQGAVALLGGAVAAIRGAYAAIAGSATAAAAEVAAANATIAGTTVAARAAPSLLARAAPAVGAVAGPVGIAGAIAAGLYLGITGEARREEARMAALEKEFAQPVITPATQAMWARARTRRAIEYTRPHQAAMPIAPAAAPVAPGAGITDLQARVQGDRLVIDLGLEQYTPPGVMDDQTTDYLEDIAYAGETY